MERWGETLRALGSERGRRGGRPAAKALEALQFGLSTTAPFIQFLHCARGMMQVFYYACVFLHLHLPATDLRGSYPGCKLHPELSLLHQPVLWDMEAV